MTSSIIPETAPFNSAQRAWLTGFFSGLLHAQPGSAPAAQADAAPQEEEDTGFPWHDPGLSLDERMKLAADKSPARQFMAAMAQLDCGQCGYLCKTYGEAIASGEEKDLTRCAPGGKETSRKLKELTGKLPIGQPSPVAVTVKGNPPAPSTSTHTRENPYPARLLRIERLNESESEKDSRLVVFDLKSSQLAYEPGDALGIWPENCPDLVDEILRLLSASGAEDVTLGNGRPASFREAMLEHCSITFASESLLESMAAFAEDPAERDAIRAILDDESAPPMQIADLLKRFVSVRPRPADFVAALSPLQPRLYSISSSLRAHPDQVHLTVGVVRYTTKTGRRCKGVASTYCTERLRPGMKARVFIHSNPRFRLPPSGDTPIIMVGPGTGIAPFRGFLQERKAASARGKAWLFFGDQRSSCDFLYREEMAGYLRDNTLTRLDTAFSRDQSEKVYVQHRMLENAEDVWQWLSEGAHFYVCGDAKRMASDVDAALRKIIAEQGGVDANTYIAEMTRTGRYQRDVY
jgi:sulfite reductase (NADPH) flavoprotein alpha-component